MECVNDLNLGMGLSSSKTILTSMHGDIKVNRASDKHSGFTSFKFKIPVKVSNEPARADDQVSTLCSYERINASTLFKLNKDLRLHLKAEDVQFLNKVEFLMPQLELEDSLEIRR